MPRYPKDILALRERITEIHGWVRTATTESKRGFAVHVDTVGYGWTGRGDTEREALLRALLDTPLALVTARAKGRFGYVPVEGEDAPAEPIPYERNPLDERQ